MGAERLREGFAVEWDEYGQGYDVKGRLVVCICGERRRNGDWSDHFCSYDNHPGVSAPVNDDQKG